MVDNSLLYDEEIYNRIYNKTDTGIKGRYRDNTNFIYLAPIDRNPSNYFDWDISNLISTSILKVNNIGRLKRTITISLNNNPKLIEFLNNFYIEQNKFALK